MPSVDLRPIQQIDLNAPPPTIALLKLGYDDVQNAARNLVVVGIAPGLASVVVTATSSAASATGTVPCSAGGHFSAALALAVAGAFDYAVIEAKDAQPAAGAQPVFDRAVAQLGAPGEIDLAPATIANFDKARLGFLAGNPDRVISSGTFVRLHTPYQIGKRATADTIYIGGAAGMRRLSLDFLDDFGGALNDLSVEVNAGKLSVAAYYATAGRKLRDAVETNAEDLDGKGTVEVNKAMVRARRAGPERKDLLADLLAAAK
jgi:hypothetical protein